MEELNHLQIQGLILKIQFLINMIKLQINLDSDFEKLSNEICDKDFELAPYQKFIKNFLSSSTPYNGLLLYHGLEQVKLVQQ